ncbi:MAG: DUF3536 domain-containing protein [bacterium]
MNSTININTLKAKVGRTWAPKGDQPKKSLIIFTHNHQPLRVNHLLRPAHTLNFTSQPEMSALEASGGKAVNWTELIYQECYHPFVGQELDTSVQRRVSSDYTPALLAQLNFFDPGFSRQLKDINDLSVKDNDGHGNAAAISFSHAILPEVVGDDQKLEIIWGISYFKNIFGTAPEIFFAPEAAVDLQTLSLLVSFGIKGIILSPHQVKRVKTGDIWNRIAFESGLPVFDFGRPYSINIGNGQSIYALFYNPSLASDFAFKDILNGGGEGLANAINFQLEHYQTIAVATDGETFGHHKKNGIHSLERFFAMTQGKPHQITNFGRVLAEALKEPRMIAEAEIQYPSSWSCWHGIGRWSYDCGCAGDNPWRGPLRTAINNLASRADGLFFKGTDGFLKDAAGARERYINVLMGNQTFKDFLSEELKNGKRCPSSKFKDISMLFNSLLPRLTMKTSCGWFFEGMGLETGLNLAAAADLTRILSPLDPQLEIDFALELAGIQNSPNYKERGQVVNAAVAYRLAKEDQSFWQKELQNIKKDL